MTRNRFEGYFSLFFINIFIFANLVAKCIEEYMERTSPENSLHFVFSDGRVFFTHKTIASCSGGACQGRTDALPLAGRMLFPG